MKRILIILLAVTLSAFLTQGFQCASREMTTAKVKAKTKEWKVVKQALEEELTKRPNNDEAKMFYADVLKEIGKPNEIIAYIKKNQETFIDTNQATRFKAYTANRWSEYYEKSTKHYESYDKTQDTKYLDSAIQFMSYVYDVRPELASISYYIGDYYRLLANNEKMEEWLKTYIQVLTPNLEFAAKKGFRMMTSRADLIKMFGKPIKSIGKKITIKDSAYIDIFRIDGDELYTYSSTPPKQKGYYLSGWRVNAPKYWHPVDKTLLLQITEEPYNILIQYYLDKKEDNKALDLAKNVLEFDPENKRINALVIELYQSLNKTDEAINTLVALINKDPKNKIALGQLGDIYRVTEKYELAIEQYKKAIEVDTKLVAAKINMATCYKNRAGQIQAKQILESEKDPKYVIKSEEYHPMLQESAKYFVEVLAYPGYEANADIYKEIINIYLVLRENDKLKDAITKFESFEAQVNDKEQYYYDLLKIYGALKNQAKIDEVNTKLEALQK